MKQNGEEKSISAKNTSSSWRTFTAVCIVLGVAGCFAYEHYLLSRKDSASIAR